MRPWIVGVSVLVSFALLGGGCQSSPSKKSSSRASAAKTLDVNTDPCAMRLHEISGALLLYYSIHRDLPPTIEALEKVPGATDSGPLVCPVSHLPYIYVPAGVPAPDGESQIVLADATPSHGGMRWAVTILPPANGPLIAKVVPIPEPQFPRMPTTQPARMEGGR
jgi:hypothetical protein